MRPSRSDLESRVIGIVASALDRDPSAIRPHSSLIDDLGAESIDFLDIRFRVETDFKIKVPDEEIWEGALQLGRSGLITEQGVSEEGIRLLRQQMPEFRWDRFSKGISRASLPRLITVSTIIEYLERRLASEELQGA